MAGRPLRENTWFWNAQPTSVMGPKKTGCHESWWTMPVGWVLPPGTTSSSEELDLDVEKWSTHSASGQHQSQTWNHGIGEAEFDQREWEDERCCQLKRGLNDERVNNNFSPIQSCRASHSMWEWSGASNYIRYWVNFHLSIQKLSK
jgi:hypothetical protein